MDDIVKEFLSESNENLDRLDQELVKLEGEPSSKELLASIFRTIHTIKGSCGFLGFTRLEKLTHAGENLLSRLRDGELALNEEITSGLLAMVDAVRCMLGAIQASSEDGDEDYSALIGLLAHLQAGSSAAAPSPALEAPRESRPTADNHHSTKKTEANTKPKKPGRKPKLAKVSPDPTKIGGVLVERGQVRPEDLALALEIQEKGRHKIGEILVAQGAVSPEDVFAAQKTVESRHPDSVDTIRVAVTLLDRLMNLVGELVLARNQLLQFSNTLQDTRCQAVSQRVNLIATELQGEVMKTRMQPISNIWSKLPRTVRDLSVGCGKQVRLEMEGQDTELDRTIIEAIKDPLTHLIRNAMDHGIEDPEARQRAGKPATGTLTLRAFHEGGQVNIEIRDDGAGLNSDRIRRKAIERGAITAQHAAKMPELEIFNLIFLPGFSTAEKVTKVSGRGVGMDVVKTNVEKIGGAVDIHSTPGQGTTVRVRIPLTLAIIPALIATCAGERYAIPQVSLSELVRLDSAESGKGSGKGIELVQGAPVYRLRGRLLPLVFLDRELGVRDKAGKSGSSAVNIVVLQAGDRQFGLVVDEIADTEEIVVKPLNKQLKGINSYSGATIMGDGRVALILDVLGLAQKARVLAEANQPAPVGGQTEAGGQKVSDEHTLLLAQNGPEGRVAIPLAMVARLEEFPRTVVEYAGLQEVMQYRGQIIPLLRLSRIISTTSDAEKQASTTSIHVVVYSEGNRTVGLIVDRIVDIVEQHDAVETLSPHAGVLGSFVSQHHVTELLDLPAIIRAAIPGLLDAVPLEAPIILGLIPRRDSGLVSADSAS
jgi:two-component system chemotaxis sensor kinase CheA